MSVRLNFHLLFLLSAIFLFSCKPSQLPAPEEAAGPAPEEKTGPEAEEQEETPALFQRNLLLEKKEKEIEEYRASRERKFNLIHTSLDLNFNYPDRLVSGQALLIVTPFFYDQDELVLDAKDFDIHNIWMSGGKENEPLAFKYDQQKVIVYLQKTHSAKDTLKIGMSYTAHPENDNTRGGRVKKDTKGLYFINPEGKENKPTQIWTQGETEFSSKWFPTIDSPNERQTQDIRLTVDEKYLTLSNGRLLSKSQNGDGTRTDHWLMDLPHAPYLAAVVIGEFVEIKDAWKDLQVNYYMEKKYSEGAKKVFGNTPEMIGYFSNLLGVDFPWQKYDQVVVRDFVSGAMENTTISVFMEALNLNEREAIDSEWDYIIAHELFHQWFGNYVTTESWSNLPLNEAFADYSEYLWFEYKEGKDQADMHHIAAMDGYFMESREEKKKLIRYYYNDKEDMFDSHSYAKGGRVLHMLRRHLGDEAFFTSLNHYLTTHAFSSVEIHDLRLSFEKITGKDLNWFFDQWFLDAGHPELEIMVDRSQPDNLLLTVSQVQDLETSPLFKIPFTVTIYKGNEKEEKHFLLKQGVQNFALENGPGTDLVLFDESMVLLAEKQTFRGVDHFKKQFTLSQEGISRLEALDSLTNNRKVEDITLIIRNALNDPFHVVRELALVRSNGLLSFDSMDPGMEEKILALAEKDPNNSVRAAAIELLAKIDSEKFSPLFFKLVNDPSYYVSGAALAAYMDGENPNKPELVSRLEKEENIRIIVPLADYFTQIQDRDRADWFHSHIEQLSGESLYYFIGYYGDYFASVETPGQEKALDQLEILAHSDPANYIRLAAFQALFGFIDEGGVLDRVLEIHKQEEDPMVRKYQAYFIEPYLEEN